MNTEIKLIETWRENADSPFKMYRVTVNGEDAYSPFYHLPDAKAASFDECVKAAANGCTILVSYLSH